MKRRDLLRSTAALPVAAAFPPAASRADESLARLISVDWEPRLRFDFSRHLTTPLVLEAADIVVVDERTRLLRLRAKGGLVAYYPAHERLTSVLDFFRSVILPGFLGKDLRQIEHLIDAVYIANYKLVGMLFWTGIGCLEVAALDLLGRACGKPVYELLGGARSGKVFSVYLSSRDRATSPEEEVEMLERRLAQTGARAVKIGIGGRMSRNRDVAPGRSEALVSLARKRLGDGITILADANGSYDAVEGIRVGRMLESHGVSLFEEPCPFEDFEATKQVADALERIRVSGGESDSSLPKFRYMLTHQVVDVIQPDLLYNGGLLRSSYVAQMALGAGIPVVPHSPRAGMEMAPLLHFLASIANPGEFHEFQAAPARRSFAYRTEIPLLPGGRVAVPEGPGFGIELDLSALEKLPTI